MPEHEARLRDVIARMRRKGRGFYEEPVGLERVWASDVDEWADELEALLTAGEAFPSRQMADIALCTCQVISGGAVSLNLSCPLHGVSLGHKLSAPMASGLLLTLKSECEAQHARAELAEQQIATLTAENQRLRQVWDDEYIKQKRALLSPPPPSQETT